MKSLSEVVQHYMRVRNLTAAELGRRSGLSADAIAKYIAGSEPTLTALRKLCTGLDVPVQEVVGLLPGLPAVRYAPARPRGRPANPPTRKRKESAK